MTEHGIKTYTSATDTCFMRATSSQVREVAVGQQLTVGHTGTITTDADSAEVVGNAVTFTQPGRFTVSWLGGTFSVVAYESAALDLVPRQQSSGAVGRERSVAERQLVLRQLATHTDWNGTLLDAGRFTLAHYGA